MATNFLGNWTSKVSEKINEQVWFQQIKSKWEELDPQSRTYLKAAGGGGAVLLVLALSINLIWSVHQLKKELAEKTELNTLIQTANDELRRLRESVPPAVTAAAGAPAGPWPTYLETVATGAGLGKGNFEIAAEKPGANTDLAKESLFDLNIKKVNVKQLVRFAFQLENGARPIKVRNMTIDTQPDASGYLDASLAVSAFQFKQP